MMPEGPAALPHFILLSALRIWVADTLGGGPTVGWFGVGGCGAHGAHCLAVETPR